MPIQKNHASDDPILLNEVGAFIWTSAENPVEYKELLEIVSRTYGLQEASPELIAVEQFISQMLDMGLLLRFAEEV